MKDFTNILMQQNLLYVMDKIKEMAVQNHLEKEQDNNLLIQRNWAFEFYIAPKLIEYSKWLEMSDESSNYTYQLKNFHHLCGWIDGVTSCGLEKAKYFIDEILNDADLAKYLAEVETMDMSKKNLEKYPGLLYGRRIGWYAIARITKPKLIIETGVDRGLGSVILSRAAMKNSIDGYSCRYLGTDINPDAGYLLKGTLKQYGEIVYGDSIDSLKKINDPVDIFINDSDHSADYEAREYETIKPLLTPSSILLGDNSHVTNKLYEFAVIEGMSFLHFAEQPTSHWYPGAGIGAAFKNKL
jgi:hypothetical protein